MPDANTLYHPDQVPDSNIKDKENPHTMLVANLEDALASARPRLLYLARKRGVAPDAAEDIAQETLMEAWRHLDHLCSPERFDAWLNGICRNMCLRWIETQSRTEPRQTSLSDLLEEAFDNCRGEACPRPEAPDLDIPDPLAFDPTEELSRQDMAILLDRALGYLPEHTRNVVELCYLAELPQSEVALRLGLTIGALELRLHRARRRLRQVLSEELRSEAVEFGLTVDEESASGWRDTRIWCRVCGRHYLQGMFESPCDGFGWLGLRSHIVLRMRCPGCSLIGGECVYSRAPISLGRLHSFRAALKHTGRMSGPHFEQALATGWQKCQFCGKPARPLITGTDELDGRFLWPGLMLLIPCFVCNSCASTSVGTCLWSHPTAQHFMAQHPRWIMEPETFAEYAGHIAIRVRFADLAGTARLTMLAHHQTLQVLAAFQE
jgi:RNA polymerase sigma factor (sigma-70 family)